MTRKHEKPRDHRSHDTYQDYPPVRIGQGEYTHDWPAAAARVEQAEAIAKKKRFRLRFPPGLPRLT